jgi:4-amino-4-deoxy-L-arabinose transferase-like glycosyltransferase
VALFALATGLAMAFLVFRVQGLVDSNTDPYYFGEMGKSVADGNGFEGFGNLIKRRAPLYPLVIGAVYWVFGEHARLIFVVHVLMFVGTCVLVFDLGRRLFNQRTGLIAGIACAFHPMLLRYIPSLHLETQLTFLLMLVVWLTVRFHERPTVGRGALVGLAAGAATLTKAVVAPYPFLFAAGTLLACRAARRRGEDRAWPWRGLLVMIAVMAAAILPWTIRNYTVTGHLVPVSTGTSDAFLRGLIFSKTEYITLQEPPFTYAEIESNEYFRSLAEAAGTVWERDDWETDQILNEEAKRRLLAEPDEVARKTVVGLFTFWYQLTSRPNSLLALGLAVVAWVFALLGWRRARREQRPVWPVMLPVFYFNISLAFLLALGRYSVPVIPCLLVVSAYGADALLTKRAIARA